MIDPLDPNAKIGPEDFDLLDDGTLDTVVRLPTGDEYRYSDTSEYRNEDGEIDFDRFCVEVVIPDFNADPDQWTD